MIAEAVATVNLTKSQIATSRRAMEGGLTCRASSLGVSAAAKLTQGLTGRVHSVFSRALNVSGEHGMYCIVRHDVGKGPINIVLDLDGPASLQAIGVEAGLRVQKDGDKLTVGDGALSILLQSAGRYPEGEGRGEHAAGRDIASNLKVLVQEIRAAGSPQGLGCLLPYFEGKESEDLVTTLPPAAAKARLPLIDLSGALTSGRIRPVPRAARALIGLGPGLTPAADDVLVGLMLAFSRAERALGMGDEFAKRAALSICAQVRDRTTALSKEFLLGAGSGLGSEHIDTLIEALLYGSNSSVKDAARRVFGMGATSGTDVALGVFIGLMAGLERHRGGCE